MIPVSNGRDFGSLYETLGYREFRMSRFEEYGLYAENRNFLVCDRVITFNDQSGRLMALKPDVTLSIAKNCRDDGGVEKYYYNENVYRIDSSSGEFREIMQSGLECMGALDLYSVSEVLMLAARSLEMISDSCVLDISHMGVISAALDDSGLPAGAYEKALGFFTAKNAHGLRSLCKEWGVAADKAAVLERLAQMYGSFDRLLPELRDMLPPSAALSLDELANVYKLLCEMGVEGEIRLDFSIINDSSYYNGLIFRGFVRGVPRAVLSGGRYDNLLAKFGKRAGAIGFAVYLDALESLDEAENAGVDVLILYDDATDPARIAREVRALNGAGKSVRVSREIPTDMSCRHTINLCGGGRSNG